jgi:signal transduction histidine kinase
VIRCPACDEVQPVYVAAPAITCCLLCGARWVHDPGESNGVKHRERQSALGHVTHAIEEERTRLAADLHESRSNG